LAKEAFEVQPPEFVEVVNTVTALLKNENGRLGNFTVTGKLVETEPKGEAVVIGDLHGDVESFIEILQKSNILQRIEKTSESKLILLGDYGDRGSCPAETYYMILRLKMDYPEQVVLLRGNHEGPEYLMPSPHDLPSQFQARFKEKGAETYNAVRGLFDQLYNALVIRDRLLMVHGGLAPGIKRKEELAYAQTLNARNRILEDLLWSDPTEEVQGSTCSPRGAGKLFGKDITKAVLAKLNLKVLIRGHEPCDEGFRINHDGMVLTLFSRKGTPYFNPCGAYLDMHLDVDFRNAYDLQPYIHKF
jgi:protein phosphatase